MLLTFATGFGLGGGLIIAIGAQNAFVLGQGLRRNHPVASSGCSHSVVVFNS